MKRALKAMFLAVEINLVLWLAVIGSGLGTSQESNSDWLETRIAVNLPLAYVGLVSTAVLQHWAYYALCRKAQ